MQHVPTIGPCLDRFAAGAKNRMLAGLHWSAEEVARTYVQGLRPTFWELAFVVSAIDRVNGVLPPADGLAAVAAYPLVDAELDLIPTQHPLPP